MYSDMSSDNDNNNVYRCYYVENADWAFVQ